jgi:hypothetical protein
MFSCCSNAMHGSHARLDCHSYSTAALSVSDLGWGRLIHFSWGLLMPFRTNHLKTQADKYRVLAAAANNEGVRLQLLSIANQFDLLAEHDERQHQVRAERATTPH